MGTGPVCTSGGSAARILSARHRCPYGTWCHRRAAWLSRCGQRPLREERQLAGAPGQGRPGSRCGVWGQSPCHSAVYTGAGEAGSVAPAPVPLLPVRDWGGSPAAGGGQGKGQQATVRLPLWRFGSPPSAAGSPCASHPPVAQLWERGPFCRTWVWGSCSSLASWWPRSLLRHLGRFPCCLRGQVREDRFAAAPQGGGAASTLRLQGGGEGGGTVWNPSPVAMSFSLCLRWPTRCLAAFLYHFILELRGLRAFALASLCVACLTWSSVLELLHMVTRWPVPPHLSITWAGPSGCVPPLAGGQCPMAIPFCGTV